MDKSLSVIEGQLRECYGRAVYSHKTHEKCADILLTRLSRIKLLQIVLSAVTTGSFLTMILDSGKEAAIVGVLVSTVLLVLNAYTKNYDLGELAEKHKQAANDIWLIREQYLSLLTNLAAGGKTNEPIQAEGIVSSSHFAAYMRVRRVRPMRPTTRPKTLSSTMKR
jgi:hypothetical protein